jgi:hypothetical protein
MKTCKKCGIEKELSSFYGYMKTCKDCKYLISMELKKIADKTLTNCSECKREFGEGLKHSAKGMCAFCYKSKWLEKKYAERATCIDCNVIFNPNNKQTDLASNGRCRRCYDKWRKTNLKYECVSCGDPIPNGSIKAKCSKCNLENKLNTERRYAMNMGVQVGHITHINKDQFESIRILMTRWNRGMFTPVDTFRVALLHESVFGSIGSSWGHDTKSPEIQSFIMLKELKSIWLFNKDLF